jgi:hypothetical protein
VGVAEEKIRGQGIDGQEWSIDYRYSCRSTVDTSLLAEAFNALDTFKITLRVGDLSPRSS